MNGKEHYGSIKTYVKIIEACRNVICLDESCHCARKVCYFSLIEDMDLHPQQPSVMVKGRYPIEHLAQILRSKADGRFS